MMTGTRSHDLMPDEMTSLWRSVSGAISAGMSWMTSTSAPIANS
jgi:hypothetical protein